MFALDNLGVGIVNGSIISFLVVYATRLGATSVQVGLINAVPALVSLIVALPAGVWLARQPVKKVVVNTALLFRTQYLLLAIIPFIKGDLAQIYAIIAAIFITALPGTILNISFNAFFADAVPITYRAYVASNRMASFSVANVTCTLLCGFILNSLPMPIGYQVVFLIGFLGAVLSTYALWQIKHEQQISDEARAYGNLEPVPALAREKTPKLFSGKDILHLEILKGDFSKYLAFMFLFHLFIFIPAPLFPIYTVRQLGLSDLIISVGYATFYIAVLFGSRYMTSLAARHGTKIVMGIGAALTCTYPLFLITGQGAYSLMAASIFGGIAWAFAGGMMYNYILEKMPEGDKAAHLSWYNIIFNLALLVALLGGGILGNALGLFIAILIFGIGRAIAGFLIWRWG